MVNIQNEKIFSWRHCEPIDTKYVSECGANICGSSSSSVFPLTSKTLVHTPQTYVYIYIHGCYMLNGIYKETNACYIYDLFILCCYFRARQPNYAKRTCFSVACVCVWVHTKFILAVHVFILVDPVLLNE